MPLSSAADVDAAVRAANEALPAWRRTPPGDRIQPLFRLKALLDAHATEIARIITQECGKTLAEAEGELRRGIENVEVATGIPSLMIGSNLEDIASGIDELMIRQPVGIVAAITPFNFPAMIPLWFLPYAVGCGNTIIIKPSEKTPMTMGRIFELIEAAGFPPGVVNLVHGGKDGRRRAARSSGRPGDLVRRLDAGRPLRLRPRRRQRQARAMPGRRQEPDRHPARRRHGDDDADCRRLGVRLRRPALSGLLGRHHRRRGRRRRSPARSPRRLRAGRSAMASTPASRWGR